MGHGGLVGVGFECVVQPCHLVLLTGLVAGAGHKELLVGDDTPTEHSAWAPTHATPGWPQPVAAPFPLDICPPLYPLSPHFHPVSFLPIFHLQYCQEGREALVPCEGTPQVSFAVNDHPGGILARFTGFRKSVAHCCCF